MLRLGINTEVSRYTFGIGNTKQLTTNTIYRIGSLLYILARIYIGGGSGGEHVWGQSFEMSTSKVMFDANILWEAQLMSMFGASLTKCQLLKSRLAPIL